MSADSPTPPVPGTGRTVACPACREATRYAPENPWRPFCSARCKGVDLGAWASEDYRVSRPAPHPEDDAG